MISARTIKAAADAVKGSKAAIGSLKAGVRKIQGPYPATLRQDVVSTTA